MFKEGSYLFIVRVLSAILGIVFSILITRTTDSVSAGFFFFVISAVTTVTPLGMLGLGHMALKKDFFLRDHTAYFLKALGFIALTALVLGLIITFLIYTYSDKLDYHGISVVVCFSILLIMVSGVLSEYLNFIFQSMRKAWLGTLTLVVLRQFLCIVFIYFFNFNNIESIIIFYGLVNCVIVIFSLVYILFDGKRKKAIDGSDFTVFSKSMWSFVGIHTLGTINGGLLPLFVGAILGTSSVAYFVIAHKVVSMVNFVIVPINRVFAPRFANAALHDSVSLLQSLASKAFITISSVSIPLLLSVFIYSNEILSVFGEGYVEQSSSVLKIMLLGQLINVLCGTVGWLLQMSGEEKSYFFISLIGLLVSLALGYFLSGILNVLAFAVAYSSSLIIVNLYSALVVWKKLKVNIFSFKWS
ncbi:oligosaccharide flippase family protein [Idiomarina abyssalis]|uniref:oligosaccharide flippase family protein n=1 Tax=Idiomarina abyssalis TaxID=86102 RepID=UPI001CD2C33A|nr:oligosaccharide flippase family protein [Idiomarina abyssalis]